MLGNKTVMILSPHADDAELGCGGLIARVIAEGGTVIVLLATTGEVKFHHLDSPVTPEDRLKEFYASMKYLGVQHTQVLAPGYDSKLNTYPQGDLVSKLDKAQNEFQPDIFLIPLPSFHQDHRYCWDVGVASTRPSGSKFSPTLVAGYEYPLSFWGGNIGANALFGGVYVDISKYWEKKLGALAHYKSQVSEDHGLVSFDGASTLASLRGAEAGVEKAEAIYALRMKV